MDSRNKSEESDSFEQVEVRSKKYVIPKREHKLPGQKSFFYDNGRGLYGCGIYSEGDVETGHAFRIIENIDGYKSDRITNMLMDVDKRDRDTYFYVKNTSEVFYNNGRRKHIETVTIDDLEKFKKSLTPIMEVKKLVYTYKHLSDDEINELITSNGGHKPHPISDEHGIKKFLPASVLRLFGKHKSSSNDENKNSKSETPVPG